jgi:hypothetical protein
MHAIYYNYRVLAQKFALCFSNVSGMVFVDRYCVFTWWRGVDRKAQESPTLNIDVINQ